MDELGLFLVVLGGFLMGYVIASPGIQVVLAIASGLSIATGYFLCGVKR